MYGKKRAPLALGILALGLLVASGCGRPTFDSRWQDRSIDVDGQDADWQGATFYVEKANVVVGLLNDAHYLYLYLGSTERAIQSQLLFRGFTVWFDPKGGKEEYLGIRFRIITKDKF